MADKCLHITGSKPLAGTIAISGAKNSALPCLFATLLSDAPSKLSNLPAVIDIDIALASLTSLGHVVKTSAQETVTILPQLAGRTNKLPIDFARAMRASILSLGPLLSRRGEAIVPLPGGCDFGTRPIDIHLRGLAAMGASIEMRGGVLYGQTKGLRAAHLQLEYPTFTGTENLLMAATLADGTTVIENAACEPEVVDLANMLNAMGARIDGAGSATLTVKGVHELHGANHTIMPDRIEVGTYIAAVLVTGGELVLTNAIAQHLAEPLQKFVAAGATIRSTANSICITTQGRPAPFDVVTAPYPGYPTDLQAQSLAVNAVATGKARITDTVWQQRFRTVDELKLLGADISVTDNTATVYGTEQLFGAHVQASDLRASAALVIGGLAAAGETIIHGVHHLERGYADLPGKLRALGAQIELV